MKERLMNGSTPDIFQAKKSSRLERIEMSTPRENNIENNKSRREMSIFSRRENLPPMPAK